MSDFDNAVSSARNAQNSGREIDDATARVIGSMYHEGQSTVSYAFVSTGAIIDVTDLYREMFPNTEAMSADERLLASMFGTYTHTRPDRRGVAGWSTLWL
jgi:hypothetical protein